MTMQQIDHRPQVAAFLDVDLEEVAQVVEARRRAAEVALLLDGGGLGVALGHDDAPQVRAVLAGHVLPRGLAEVIAEMDPALLHGGREEDAPAVIGHLHVAEARPVLGVDAGRGAQVHVVALRALGTHLAPPCGEIRLPLLERAL